MFQISTANVTSIIFEILDFLFKIVMVVFETLQKKNHIFKTVFVNVHQLLVYVSPVFPMSRVFPSSRAHIWFLPVPVLVCLH